MVAERPKVFISYSKEDRDSAASLADALKQRGIEPLVDLAGQSGGDWREEVEREISQSDAVICLVSGSANRSRWATREWELALTAAWDRPELRLIPVVEHKADPPGFLRDRQWITYSGRGAQPVEWSSIAEEVSTTLAKGGERDTFYRARADEERRAHLERMGVDLAPLVEAESTKK
jgi:hypothetical protein